jgi:hypothetical protein
MEPLGFVLLIAFGFGAGSVFTKKPCDVKPPAPIVQEAAKPASSK